MYVLMLTYNMAFDNNEDYGWNGMKCNYNQVMIKIKNDLNYLMPIS